ncbi:MAG: phosphonate metabolism protein/1,5-bisphosphokinase (PRPP-forming) PhnN [Alphaproteobacteria bacterium]|nr:phosphonate metabolism protein/1,5-bisphosphokinase (PRPP-forming) PhnN [Alphaproteobacteria bacterium]
MTGWVADTGQLVAVVGPSGVGKDTLIDAFAKARPDAIIVRRVITRAAGAPGEDHDTVSEALFDAQLALGRYAVHWSAHGLRYAIPATIDAHLAKGRLVVFNGSRKALPLIRARYPRLQVVMLTASVDVLQQRLQARGRETAREIAARLKRAELDPPEDAHVIVNDGSLDDALAHMLRVLNLSARSA